MGDLFRRVDDDRVSDIGVALLPTASNGSLAPGGAAIVATLHLLWLESIAIVAFGLSWLVNGEVFLADPPDTAATS
jgi:hypothetical protein